MIIQSPVPTNAARAVNGLFSFVVVAPAGQSVAIPDSDALQPGSGNILTTTRTPAGGRFQGTDPADGASRK